MNDHDQNSSEQYDESLRNSERTPTKKRILALIGAIFVIALTILYAYSIATGMIFAW